MPQTYSVLKAFGLVLCCLAALLALVTKNDAVQAQSPILNPKTYFSHSGDFSLYVNPSDKHGKAGATYRLNRNNEIVWEGKRSYTLWEAGVTDDGTIGGYAYSSGPSGWRDNGAFEVVILDPHGRERAHKITKRSQSRYMHASPNPLALGLVFDGPNDLMDVRLLDEDLNQADEKWWEYRLSTGLELRRYSHAHISDDKKSSPAILPLKFVAPTVPLRLIDKIALRIPNAKPLPPIRRVFNLISAGQDRLAFLRRESKTDLVVLNTRGGVDYTVSLDSLQKKDVLLSKLIWQGGTRFLLFIEHSSSGLSEIFTTAYQIDARLKSISSLSGFRSPRITSVASTPNGGFAALAGEVYVYDRYGVKIWSTPHVDGHGPDERPQDLFSPEALTILKDGSIAVLDVIIHTVQFFSPRGRYLRTISLDKSLKKQASYPSEIYSSADGGFVVFDSGGIPSIYRMTLRGGVWQTFTPRYKNGKEIENPEMCVSPDGSLWISDSYSLLMLNKTGHISKRLGEAPDAGQLRSIVELAVSPEGLIYAADERTNSVHVFDYKGNWLHVFKPAGAGQESPATFRSIDKLIELGPDGTFAIAGQWFDADGKHRGLPAGYIPIGRRTQKIERRPDNTWLEYITAIVKSSGGEFAILDNEESFSFNPQSFLSLYSASSAPERMIAIPTGLGGYPAPAYDGKQVVLSGNARIYCYDRSGKPGWLFILPGKNAEELSWTPYLTNSGRTLCLFDGEHALFRYAMPEQTKK